jgi:hypothetical protein
VSLQCFHCKKGIELPSGARVGFRDTCAHCGSDLHACLNCNFYDEGTHHECRESSAEWVKDKESSNVCEYFRPKSSSLSGATDKQKALDALDALFKKG